jgi:hypothetical protein
MFLEIHPILSSTSGHRAPHPQVSARLRFQIILQGLQRCLQVVVVPGHRDGALGVHGSKENKMVCLKIGYPKVLMVYHPSFPCYLGVYSAKKWKGWYESSRKL